jgi:hypothetical protein
LLGLLLLDFSVLTDDLYFNSFGEQLTYERIVKLIEKQRDWKWISYVFVPLFYFVKFTAVIFFLSIGALLLRIEYSIIEFYLVVINSEFVYIMSLLSKTIWFGLFQSNFTLIDLQHFSPLSIFSIFNPHEIGAWLIYPLQLLNLFELAYWCVLAWQLKNILNRDFIGSLGFVASTYGVGLLLWVIFVMFLTVSLT